jgi:hypothetical protein
MRQEAGCAESRLTRAAEPDPLFAVLGSVHRSTLITLALSPSACEADSQELSGGRLIIDSRFVDWRWTISLTMPPRNDRATRTEPTQSECFALSILPDFTPRFYTITPVVSRTSRQQRFKFRLFKVHLNGR